MKDTEEMNYEACECCDVIREFKKLFNPPSFKVSYEREKNGKRK